MTAIPLVGRERTPLYRTIGHAGAIFKQVARANIALDLVNFGGGFPVVYRDRAVPPPEAIAETIMTAVDETFGNNRPRLMAEPGRALVADAGVIRSEVVLVSTRDPETPERWVYLDIGRFGGLTEGDLVDIHAAGAYTTTCSSVGFNGFPPLAKDYV